MAVYTDVPAEALDRFLTEYDVGTLQSAKGIAEGVENTNYLVSTTKGRFILTLYEKRVDAGDLPFFLGLTEHVAAKGFPCPLPVRGRDGEAVRPLSGRPAALITFLEGVSVHDGAPDQCRQVGEALARLHTLAADFKLTRTNSLGPDAWAPFFSSLADRADDVAPGLRADITAELDWLCNNRPSALPAGIIHADLFPDNVFFLNGRLAGVIDFYFACHDALVFDLAVAVNAWCFDADDRFIEERCTALLEGYEAVRPLDPREHAALAFYCRGTALRFLLTRLHDWIHHVPGSLVAPKDPRQFLARLHHHRQTPFS